MCVSECLTLRAPCIAWFLSGSAAPSMMCICMARRIPIDRDPFCASIMALLFRVPNYAFFSWPRASIFSVPSGLMGRTPLTSPRRIGAYLERCPGHDGLARAREALRFVCAEAASPPEVFMRLVLGLPARLGGFGLSGSVMNRRIKPSKRAKALAGRESLVPDLYLPDCKLDIEFDSNAEHLTARQATLDATKRMALESDGLKVITVTTSQLASASAMRHVAQEAHARRGTRLRLRCKNFALRQKRLYQLRWSMDDYLDEGWVAAQRSCCRSSALHVEVF